MNILDIKISKKDWEMLSFNVFEENDGKSATLKFDPLKRAWRNYKMPLSYEKFCVAFYDINSPLHQLYTDWKEKKVVAGILSGFEIDEATGLFKEEFDDVINGRNERFNNNVFEFIKLFRSAELEHLMTLKSNYYQIRDELNKTGETKKDDADIAKIKADTMIKLDTLYKMIRSTEQDYLQDATAALRKDFFKVLDNATQRLPISAENRLLHREK